MNFQRADVRSIRSVAILGAGTMGSQIAAHMANAGVPVLLLDLNVHVAKEGLERTRKLKPEPFFTTDVPKLISLGGFDQDLDKISDYDWIIEAIVENLQKKKTLIKAVETHRHPTAIVSSNTSGIRVSTIAESCSDNFRRYWLGTHFFNPPRYLRLLEVIPTQDTDPSVVEKIKSFANYSLGKSVIVARDTPNFIANNIGLHGIMRTLQVLENGNLTIEEIDAITGPVIGRPKSATFRTIDMVGIDVLSATVKNLSDRLEDDADRLAFSLPPFIQKMLERDWIGEKSGQGFYRKTISPNGSEILVLDPVKLEYRTKLVPRLDRLEATRHIKAPSERLRALFLGRDSIGDFMRATLGSTLVYAATVAPTIAHSIDDVDRAMHWGFGWNLGPFEIWDVIGIENVLTACEVVTPPQLIGEILERGRGNVHSNARFRKGLIDPEASDPQLLRKAKNSLRIVRTNPSASLVDIGDGILALEFHSKINTIDLDTVQMLSDAVKEASKHFCGLIVGNDATNFSAGANLVHLLENIQESRWESIDRMVRSFQSANTGLRYAHVPVVIATSGLALGGGCEIALHGYRVQAAAETYMGLVEVAVGLIPAGGGVKEMLVRSIETDNTLLSLQSTFETIGFAKVSSSGPDARRLGYLRTIDGFTMNRQNLMVDAKTLILSCLNKGYHRPQSNYEIRVGGESSLAALKLGIHLTWRAGRISDHDASIARKLANILSGGALAHPTSVSEQYLLDLEREAFLSLCGERKTQERIKHTLTTGKTLRN